MYLSKLLGANHKRKYLIKHIILEKKRYKYEL